MTAIDPIQLARDDRRTRRLDVDQARLWFYEGVIRTQQQLIDEGKVRW